MSPPLCEATSAEPGAEAAPRPAAEQGRLRPVEIVGGGLAGLSLGVALRHAGVPVTLHEAGQYPRHRVCGEFIAGLGEATIAALRLQPYLEGALRHREIEWHIEGKRVRLQRLRAPALGISRHTLDARLAEAFVALGGELRTASRASVNDEAPGRVFATGRRPVPASPWLGLKVHVAGLALGHELELHLGSDAYVGLARLPGGTTNVCGLFHRRDLSLRGYELLLAYLRDTGLGALAGRLSAAKIEGETFCAVAGLQFDRRVPAVEANRLALGDTSATIPPFTGNGMAMAFQSAEAALAPLLAYARWKCDWTTACRDTHAALCGRFKGRLAAANWMHPFLLRPKHQRLLALFNRWRLLPIDTLSAQLH